jgi:hypothetical protein
MIANENRWFLESEDPVEQCKSLTFSIEHVPLQGMNLANGFCHSSRVKDCVHAGAQ